MTRARAGAWPRIALLSIAMTQPAMAAYWVESFTEDGEVCRISRGGEYLEILPLMALSEGDIVDCRTTAAKVFVVTHDDQIIEVSSRNSPLIVPDTPEPPTLIENIRQAARDWFSDQLDSSLLTVSLSVRGPKQDPVRIVGANRSRNLILNSRGPLRVMWTGGQPPYGLQVLRGDGTSVLRTEHIRSLEHEVPVGQLSPGPYRLSVSDSSGSDSIPVSVVPESRQPDVVDSLDEVPIPHSIRDRYRARVLASYPDWRLQGLSMISERSVPAAEPAR